MGLNLRFPSEQRHYAKGGLPVSLWTPPGGPEVEIGLSYLNPRDLTTESRPGTPMWVSRMSLDMANGWPDAMPPLLALKQKTKWLVIDGHHRHAAAGQVCPVLWLDDTDNRVTRYMVEKNSLPLNLEMDLVNSLKEKGWDPACMKNWVKTMSGDKPSRETLSRPGLLQRMIEVATSFVK
jgi:hypothetical protein